MHIFIDAIQEGITWIVSILFKILLVIFLFRLKIKTDKMKIFSKILWTVLIVSTFRIMFKAWNKEQPKRTKGF